ATVTDTDLITPAGDFTATIDWGDGTGVTAGVVGGSAGNFTVSGNHTYSAVGNQTVHVTLTDDAPGTASASGNSTIIVNRGVLGSAETLVNATGNGALVSATVATFTDTDPTETTGNFTASINWGDGCITAGVLGGGSGNFSVSGNHTYADEGVNPVSVSITRTADSANTTAIGNVTVAEHDVLTYHSVATVNETRGVATGSIVVATVTDTDLITPAGDFTATIDWRDGTGVT